MNIPAPTKKEKGGFSWPTKFLIILGIVLLIVLIWGSLRVIGGTTINLTLTTNPDLEDGLVGHWTFDGITQSQITDSSSVGNHAVHGASASVTPTIGRIGKALQFGANDNTRLEVSDPGDGSLDFSSTTSFTVSAWVWIDDVISGGWWGVVRKHAENGSYSSPLLGYVLGITGGGSGSMDARAITLVIGDNTNKIAKYSTQNIASLGYGRWHHLVGVINRSSGEMSMYINGVQEGSAADISMIGPLENGNDFHIGDDLRSWQGKIDDVRMYNEALSAEEITRLYQLGGTTRINKTITSNPDLENGLVGHWTFDGKDMVTNVADSSGQGNDGGLIDQTPTTTTLGVIGQALEFDGSDDYVNVGSLGKDASTIAFWMNVETDITSATACRQILQYGTNAPEANQEHLLIGSCSGFATAETLMIMDEVVAPDFDRTYIKDTITAGWHHVVFRWAGSNYEIYIDGSSKTVFASSDTGGDHVNPQVTVDELEIGGDGDGSYTFFDGSLDDIRIYSRSLSAEEITRLYQLGGTTRINKTITSNPDLEDGLVGHWTFDGKDMVTNVADTSGQGNHGGLLNQTPTTTTLGVIGQALDIDGNDDTIDLPNGVLNGESDVTTTFWMRTTKTGQQAIVSGATSGNDNEYLIYLPSDVSIQFFTGESSGSSASFSVSSMADGEWHHYAVVRDDANDEMNVYVDGVADNENPKSTTLNSLTVDSGGLRVGQEQDSVGDCCNPTQAFDGSIDDLRIYNRALSADEITRLYEMGK